MKKIIVILLSASLAFLTSAAFAHKGKKDGRIEILHKPPNEHIIITVNESSLEAHLAHGDCVLDDDDGGGGGGGEEDSHRPDSDMEITYCIDEEDD